MTWDEYGFQVPRKEITGPVSDASIRACPFNRVDSSETDEDVIAADMLRSAPNVHPELGHYERTYIGYSKDHRRTSSSGGIATYIFSKLFESGVAQHIFVVTGDNGTYRYRLISNQSEVSITSKTRYYPVTLDEFFAIAMQVEGRIAVSGVACFVKSIRMRQRADAVFREKVSFITGIICGGWKSRSFTEYLADRAGAGADFRNPEYRVKDENSTSNDYSFSAMAATGSTHTMKMAKVGDMWGTGMFKAKACDFCTDVMTELADISLGDAWLPEYRSEGLGNSIIITRSSLAEELIQRGISNNELIARPCDEAKVVASQHSSFLHRRDALKFRIGVAKILNQPVPYVRKRVLKRISFSYAMVQILREITRSKSLDFWRKAKSSGKFDRRMRPYLLALKIATRINQKIRRK